MTLSALSSHSQVTPTCLPGLEGLPLVQADAAPASSVPLMTAADGGTTSTSIPEARCCTELHHLIVD